MATKNVFDVQTGLNRPKLQEPLLCALEQLTYLPATVVVTELASAARVLTIPVKDDAELEGSVHGAWNFHLQEYENESQTPAGVGKSARMAIYALRLVVAWFYRCVLLRIASRYAGNPGKYSRRYLVFRSIVENLRPNPSSSADDQHLLWLNDRQTCQHATAIEHAAMALHSISPPGVYSVIGMGRTLPVKFIEHKDVERVALLPSDDIIDVIACARGASVANIMLAQKFAGPTCDVVIAVRDMDVLPPVRGIQFYYSSFSNRSCSHICWPRHLPEAPSSVSFTTRRQFKTITPVGEVVELEHVVVPVDCHGPRPVSKLFSASKGPHDEGSLCDAAKKRKLITPSRDSMLEMLRNPFFFLLCFVPIVTGMPTSEYSPEPSDTIASTISAYTEALIAEVNQPSSYVTAFSAVFVQAYLRNPILFIILYLVPLVTGVTTSEYSREYPDTFANTTAVCILGDHPRFAQRLTYVPSSLATDVTTFAADHTKVLLDKLWTVHEERYAYLASYADALIAEVNHPSSNVSGFSAFFVLCVAFSLLVGCVCALCVYVYNWNYRHPRFIGTVLIPFVTVYAYLTWNSTSVHLMYLWLAMKYTIAMALLEVFSPTGWKTLVPMLIYLFSLVGAWTCLAVIAYRTITNRYRQLELVVYEALVYTGKIAKKVTAAPPPIKTLESMLNTKQNTKARAQFMVEYRKLKDISDLLTGLSAVEVAVLIKIAKRRNPALTVTHMYDHLYDTRGVGEDQMNFLIELAEHSNFSVGERQLNLNPDGTQILWPDEFEQAKKHGCAFFLFYSATYDGYWVPPSYRRPAERQVRVTLEARRVSAKAKLIPARMRPIVDRRLHELTGLRRTGNWRNVQRAGKLFSSLYAYLNDNEMPDDEDQVLAAIEEFTKAQQFKEWQNEDLEDEFKEDPDMGRFGGKGRDFEGDIKVLSFYDSDDDRQHPDNYHPRDADNYDQRTGKYLPASNGQMKRMRHSANGQWLGGGVNEARESLVRRTGTAVLSSTGGFAIVNQPQRKEFATVVINEALSSAVEETPSPAAVPTAPVGKKLTTIVFDEVIAHPAAATASAAEVSSTVDAARPQTVRVLESADTVSPSQAPSTLPGFTDVTSGGEIAPDVEFADIVRGFLSRAVEISNERALKAPVIGRVRVGEFDATGPIGLKTDAQSVVVVSEDMTEKIEQVKDLRNKHVTVKVAECRGGIDSDDELDMTVEGIEKRLGAASERYAASKDPQDLASVRAIMVRLARANDVRSQQVAAARLAVQAEDLLRQYAVIIQDETSDYFMESARQVSILECLVASTRAQERLLELGMSRGGVTTQEAKTEKRQEPPPVLKGGSSQKHVRKEALSVGDVEDTEFTSYIIQSCVHIKTSPGFVENATAIGRPVAQNTCFSHKHGIRLLVSGHGIASLIKEKKTFEAQLTTTKGQQTITSKDVEIWRHFDQDMAIVDVYTDRLLQVECAATTYVANSNIPMSTKRKVWVAYRGSERFNHSRGLIVTTTSSTVNATYSTEYTTGNGQGTSGAGVYVRTASGNPLLVGVHFQSGVDPDTGVTLNSFIDISRAVKKITDATGNVKLVPVVHKDFTEGLLPVGTLNYATGTPKQNESRSTKVMRTTPLPASGAQAPLPTCGQKPRHR